MSNSLVQANAQALASLIPAQTGGYGTQVSGSTTFSTGGGTITGGGGYLVSNSTTYTSIVTSPSDFIYIDHSNELCLNSDALIDLNGHKLLLHKGKGTLELPDGTTIEIDDFGNYRFRDKNKKIRYFKKGQTLHQGSHLLMPDGTKLIMDDTGGFRIDDSNAKVIYQSSNKREFNPYVNASEMLGDFVGDLGKVGVVQSKVLNTPIEYFINWLIHRAAEKDHDPYASQGVPTLIESKPYLPQKVAQPKCKHCGRFISNKRAKLGINFCNALHMEQYELKMGIAA